jgi:S1-C subfamily serine protease
MQRSLVLLCALSFGFGITGRAAAQPALERLEQQVRERSQNAPRERADAGGAEDNTGYLGLVADDRLDQQKGVRIVQVIPGSPAETSGLKVDDLVTAVAGKPVRSMEDMARILAPARVGSKLIFEIKRDRRIQQLEVTLGRRPPQEERAFEEFGLIPDEAQPPASSVIPRAGQLGVRVDAVTEETQAKLNLPSTEGALIVYVYPGSPAAEAELPLQGVIVAVDDSAVTNAADLKRLLAAAGVGAKVKISYYAQGQLHEREIRLTAAVGASPSAPGPWRMTPAMPSGAPAPSKTDARISLLEQRVQELEQRIAELEGMLKRGAEDQAPPPQE